MSDIDKLGLAPFDASDYLDDEETITEYLRAALENPDPNAFQEQATYSAQVHSARLRREPAHVVHVLIKTKKFLAHRCYPRHAFGNHPVGTQDREKVSERCSQIRARMRYRSRTTTLS